MSGHEHHKSIVYHLSSHFFAPPVVLSVNILLYKMYIVFISNFCIRNLLTIQLEMW